VISAVLFDLDGLLADSEPLHCRAYRETLEVHGISITDADYLEHWVRAGKGILELIEERGIAVGAATLRREKAERYEALVRASLRPMRGAQAALERLARSRTLALASSSYRDSVLCVTDHLRFTPFFAVIVGGSDVPRPKPEPDVFLRAAELLGVSPSECLVVEDAEKGLVASRRAGMSCVVIPNAYTRGHDFTGAARVLSSLDELTVELVDALASGVEVRRIVG